MEKLQSFNNIIILIAGGILIITILVISIFFFLRMYIQKTKEEIREKEYLKIKHQKELLKASVEIQEKERKRIALDLHDDLISKLYRIKLSTEEKKMNRLLGESIATARAISHDLSPPMFEKMNLKDLLLDYIQPFQQRFQIVLFFQEFETFMLNATQVLHVFRIVQEIVVNSIKHAEASKLEIDFRISREVLFFRIRDNGKGMMIKSRKGLGLQNIALRTQILQGQYKFKSKELEGTTFLFVMHNE